MAGPFPFGHMFEYSPDSVERSHTWAYGAVQVNHPQDLSVAKHPRGRAVSAQSPPFQSRYTRVAVSSKMAARAAGSSAEAATRNASNNAR